MHDNFDILIRGCTNAFQLILIILTEKIIKSPCLIFHSKLIYNYISVFSYNLNKTELFPLWMCFFPLKMKILLWLLGPHIKKAQTSYFPLVPGFWLENLLSLYRPPPSWWYHLQWVSFVISWTFLTPINFISTVLCFAAKQCHRMRCFGISANMEKFRMLQVTT